MEEAYEVRFPGMPKSLITSTPHEDSTRTVGVYTEWECICAMHRPNGSNAPRMNMFQKDDMDVEVDCSGRCLISR
jgi:hypothetical protein